jgi:hypothetical protein
MSTVDSISVGRFDQNLAVQRIFPPPCSPTRSYSRCSRWPCALFVPYLVPGSQWLRVYDFLLHSMTHAAQKNTENRPEDSKLWPLECLNKGSVYAHRHVCVSSKPLWTSSAPTICLRGVLKSCLGLSDYRGFHFCRSLRSKSSRSAALSLPGKNEMEFFSFLCKTFSTSFFFKKVFKCF